MSGATTKPSCPNCKSERLEQDGVSHRCTRCKFRLVVDEDGSTRAWLDFARAGRRYQGRK